MFRQSTRSTLITMGISGFAWTALVWGRLQLESSGAWRWRDDAVITLSHAKNWVEFGTIGVSPGDRVEGFSAPLQFLIASGAFAVAPIGFDVFLDIFVLTFLFLTGALIAGTLIRVASQSNWSDRKVLLSGSIIGVATAIPVTASWTVSGWLGSGMENPLIAALLACVVFIAVGSPQRTHAIVFLATALALLGMTRIETPVLMAPLVLTSAWLVRKRQWWLVIAVPTITWAIFHLLRIATYGEVLPNTAIVQGKSGGNTQLLALLVITIAVLVFLASLWRWGASSNVLNVVWSLVLLGSLGSLAHLTITGDGEATWLGPYWMPDPGYLSILLGLALIAIAQLIRVRKARDLQPWAPELVLAAAALLPVTQYLVMGPARLDAFRVASIAVPLLALWLGVTLIRILMNSAGGSATAVTLLGVAAIAGSVWVWSLDSPRALCCDITAYQESILATSDQLRTDALGSTALPLIANPDLGKLSFEKRGLIIDLGLLGDPMLTRIMTEREDLMPIYMNKVSVPDILEMHGGWICQFNAWVQTEEFDDQWQLVDFRGDGDSVSSETACEQNVDFALWQRIDAESEYELTREILQSTRPQDVVRYAIRACSSEPGDAFRCQPVRRAVQRATQSLRESGSITDVLAEFRNSPTAELDVELLSRGPGWASRSFTAFRNLNS